MKQSDNLGKFGAPIGAQASAADIAAVPDTQATAGDGTASIALGFPPETFVARGAGGVPPRGQDMNGFLNRLSRAVQVLQAGYLGPYDATFGAAIGGYPAGAIVCGAVAGTFWVSTADANTTVPGVAGAAWQSFFAGYITQAQSDARYLLLAASALQSVTGPVTFSGAVKVTTAPAGDSSPSVASTAFVTAEVAAEATTRWAADQTLQANINAESSRATAAETSLNTAKVNRSGDTMTGGLTVNAAGGVRVNYDPGGQTGGQVTQYARLASVAGGRGSNFSMYVQELVGNAFTAILNLTYPTGYRFLALNPTGRFTDSSLGDFAYLNDLPFNITDTKVQQFTVTIPAGAQCGYNQAGYVVSFPRAFSQFIMVNASDTGPGCYAVSAQASTTQVRLWAQSPQATNGVTGAVGPITVVVTATGIY
ncbi:MAG: hypothetical protein ABF990_12640 [Acetobacter sp.]|uniref:hypothetical protein n=1 Tax=Acetobacter sp. TaxID=440 RepID=UPI0039E7A9FB